MNVRTIGDKILVQRDPKEEPQAGHLLLPDEVKKPPRTGTVLAVGDEVTCIVVGEKVFFHEYAGHFLKESQDLEESDLIVMREDEILAIENEEEA